MEAIVTLANGKKAKVTAPTKEALDKAIRMFATQSEVPKQDIPDTAETIARSAATKFLDNTFTAPEKLTSAAMQGLKAVGPYLRGGVPGINAAGNFMANNLPDKVDFPNIDAQDVFAGAQLAGEFVAGVTRGDIKPPFAQADYSSMTPLSDARAQQEQRTYAMQQANPASAQVGSSLGDTATMLAIRSPSQAPIQNAALQKAAYVAPKFVPANLTQAAVQFGKDILNSKSVANIGKLIGKSVGTGLEGAVMGVINDGDPIETAAYGFGGQMLGSLTLSGISSLKSPAALLGTAGGLWAMSRFAQEFGAGQNDLFSSVDFAFQKIQYGLILGLTSAALGAGRVGTSADASVVGKALRNNLPDVADAITAIPRNFALSLISEINKDSEGVISSGLEKIATQAEQVAPKIRNEFERAVKREDVDRAVKLLKSVGSGE